MASYQVYNQYGGNGSSVTTQQSVTWNGSQWVRSPNNSYAKHGTHSSYSTHAQEQMHKYTNYYHKWKAVEKSETQKAAYLTGEAKQEAERQVAWAKYYADQSSRVAHHYHNNPNGQPPDLPPAPPDKVDATPAPTPARVQPEVQRKEQTSHKSPGGLKRFLQRCLARCSTPEQKAKMQKEVEKAIATAIDNNAMTTTDWDNKPLITIPGEISTVNEYNSNNMTSISNDTSASYYGPPATKAADTTYYRNNSTNITNSSTDITSNKSTDKASTSGTYYGPSKSDSRTTNAREKKKSNFKQDLATNNSYYGNSSVVQEDNQYNKNLVENNSYYGRIESKLEIEGDYVSLSSNKLVKKGKKRKTKVKGDDGFLRSTATMMKRANRFGGPGTSSASDAKTVGNKMAKYMGKGLIGGAKKSLDESDYIKMTAKGTCTKLEKEYLRLTAPPRAELVRPEPILRQHLNNLKSERNSPKRRDYVWFCSQFKALRQDLTVQRIINSLTVDVYETHALVALEENDLNEYNQSQTQLKELYSQLFGDREALKNRNEFVALRLVYYVFLTGNKKYEEGSSEISNLLLSLTPELKQDPFIAHALKVRLAVAEHNYHSFFRLRQQCPTQSMLHLMEFMLPNVRQWALLRICKAYRPSVPVNFVLQELGFSKGDLEDGVKWLESCGIVLSEGRESIKAKESVVHESDLKDKNSLI
eukprot:CAMPEP_0202446760 /NCGR_PEP_ID=MMETSP1360-20130828/5330_1 /ASSEMBLY_ACC=CAM_ASM_000848 /TAXON_ID=515479 /ORGANISM="Licmophora paradoxa, Strain CCMP2313" /LENGTH=699 /DNA_ID=CAMNT_0049063435 /DNA_START=122 /DNA_END=2221 /DNA_ORIENTATION=+